VKSDVSSHFHAKVFSFLLLFEKCQKHITFLLSVKEFFWPPRGQVGALGPPHSQGPGWALRAPRVFESMEVCLLQRCVYLQLSEAFHTCVQEGPVFERNQ
jgi:hypothetical protein